MAVPILIDVPERIETERLYMRPTMPGDGAEINAAALETLDELKPWMPWVHPFPTVEQSEEACRRSYARFIERSDLRMDIRRLSDGLFIGGTGLHRVNWDIPSFEIGYWCRKSCWGQGYITEAVRGLTKTAFEVLGAKRVEIRCNDRNDRSRAVIERAGFPFEGVLRNNAVSVAGEVRSTRVYAMTPEDYWERMGGAAARAGGSAG